MRERTEPPDRPGEQLAYDEPKFQLLQQWLHDPFARVDMNGRFRDCNDLFCTMLGYSRSELLAKTYSDLTPERWYAVSRAIVDEQVMVHGHSEIYEKEYIRKDGKIIPVELRAVLERDADGEPVCMWAIVRDISGRKQVEEALRQSELRIHLATETAGIGLWQWNLQTGKIIWDAQMFRIYGIKPTSNGELDVEAVTRLVVPDESAWQYARERNFVDGLVRERQIRIRRPDGELRYIRAIETVRTNSAGQAEWLIGTNFDVTDATLAKKALEASEERLRLALSAAKAVVWERDLPGDRVTLNAESRALLGSPDALPDVLSVPDAHAIIHEADRDAVLAEVERAISEKRTYDIVFRTAPPVGERWIQTFGRAIYSENGDPVGVTAINFDITERKRAEAGAAHLAAIVTSSTDGIISKSLDGIIITWNQGAERLFGYSAGEMIGQPITLLIPAELIHEEGEILARLWAGESISHYETVRVTKDGRKIDVSLTISPMRDFAGNLIGASKIVRDISKRKAAEAALRSSEERLHLALNAASAGVWELVAESGTFWASDQTKALHGLTPDAPFTHETALAAIHPDDRALIESTLTNAIATGEPLKMEIRTVWPDGTVHWLLSQAEVKPDPSQNRILGLVIDITDRKLHEEHVQFLMREINHRAKNLLGMILAVARQTAATSPDDFIDRFEKRVQAMAANQDVLVRSDWKSIQLCELVRTQLAPFGHLGEDRISMIGPKLEISPAASQTLSMAMHELATNAVKYGSLSNDTGRVSIVWHIYPDQAGKMRFAMSWDEIGGPVVTPPARRGFGTTVIEALVKASLKCKPQIDFSPSGFAWQIDCPGDSVLEVVPGVPESPANGTTSPVATGSDGKRVLVVENEAMLAMDLADLLNSAGFDVVGPASTVAEALSLIKGKGCDTAVLDFNLGSESSELIAQILQGAKTPFVVLSGYSREQLPPSLHTATLMAKPLRSELLIAELNRCLAG
ncbi:MAG: PAS domain S-box protein [Novosphingobium sp.]